MNALKEYIVAYIFFYQNVMAWIVIVFFKIKEIVVAWIELTQ